MCQGHIWQDGFATGELTADMYQDVQPAMAAWVSQGLKTYIYSSGSREAQRNLFGHTKDGDLRGLISGFFDTKSGSKVCDCSCAKSASAGQLIPILWIVLLLTPVHWMAHAVSVECRPSCQTSLQVAIGHVTKPNHEMPDYFLAHRLNVAVTRTLPYHWELTSHR